MLLMQVNEKHCNLTSCGKNGPSIEKLSPTQNWAEQRCIIRKISLKDNFSFFTVSPVTSCLVSVTWVIDIDTKTFSKIRPQCCSG